MVTWDEWISEVQGYLVTTWQLDPDFAAKISKFLAYLEYYGLNPRIHSGFRSPEHQRELQARWDSGDRAGLRTRPATDSLHSHENVDGSPAAIAIDIGVSDQARADEIARILHIGVGSDFRSPDPGHYYETVA